MGRLRGLDALRGVAAAIVIAYHLGQAFGWFWLFPKGYLAVDFFFMLSGYVIARTYDARLMNGLGPRHFLWLRVKRLWPTMAVGTLLAVPLLSAYPSEIRPVLVVAGLLFVPVLASKNYFPLNGPQWSILFELFANAIHGFVLYRLSTRHLALLSFGAAVCSGFVAARVGSFDVGWQAHDMLAGFPRVIMSYGIGMLLWRILGDRAPARWAGWLAPFALPLAIGAVGLVPSQTWLAEIAFVVLACPAIVIAGLAWDAGRAGSVVGAWSFPLYAFHAPLIYGAISLGFGWASAVGVVLIISAIPIGIHHLRFLLQVSRSRTASGLV